jgi:hypothetical protein
MAQAYAVFDHGRFIWMLQTNVPVVLLDPGLNGTASLPNVDLTTFAGYAVHTWSPESQVIHHRLKEAGILPWWGWGPTDLICAWTACS